MARHKVGIKQRQPGMGAHPLMRYDQFNVTLAIATGIGGNARALLFDNSGLAGGKYLKIGKMTVQWFMNINQQTLIWFAIVKEKEGASLMSLDDEATIRDARSEGRLIRGPWIVSSRGKGVEAANTMYALKTVVLEDLLLDPNDDLALVSVNHLTTLSGTNNVEAFVRVFWKVVE